MQRFFVASLVSLGLIVLSWPVAAQEAKPAAKEKAPSPFEEGKSDDVVAKRQAGHLIELAEPLEAESSVEERLETKATFQAEESTLKSFTEALEKALDTPVVLAVKKLEEAAINTETPVSYRLKNVKVQTALNLILPELGLTYVLHDNVIQITTPEDASSQLVTRVYDCRELMKLPSPVRRVKHAAPANPGAEIGTSGIPAKAPEKKEEAGPDGGYDISDLIGVITTTVAPDSWDDVGGPGSIADFKGLVTISQTQQVHEEIEKLLNMLHKAGGLEEKVKVSR